MMSLETEARLIDRLYECVNVHPHKEELMQIMESQLIDLNSDKYLMLQEDAELISSCT